MILGESGRSKYAKEEKGNCQRFHDAPRCQCTRKELTVKGTDSRETQSIALLAINSPLRSRPGF